MVDHNRRWSARRSLSEAADLYGARSITVVDRLARATVWSMTFAPEQPAAPGQEDVDEGQRPRIADDVLDTVRAVELLCPGPEAASGWFEVILLSPSNYHIVHPFGAMTDALVAELVVARSANLSAARLWFGELVSAYRDATAISLTDPAWSTDQPTNAAGLPHRIAPAPPSSDRPDPDRLVAEHILDRVAAALRTMQ